MYSFQLLKSPRGCIGCGALVTSRLAGHLYQDPMCETCFRAVPEASELFDLTLGLRSVVSIEPLKWPSTGTFCANCGDRLDVRVAGHHRGKPLCVACFREHAPDLAGLLLLGEKMLEVARASLSELGSSATCARCGDHLEAGITGFQYGDPLCVACFLKHAAALGALLRLSEAALDAADTGDFRNLLSVAESYSNLLRRLGRRPRDPV